MEIRLNEKAGDNLGLIGKLEGHLIVADCQRGQTLTPHRRRLHSLQARSVNRKPPPQKCRLAVGPRGP